MAHTALIPTTPGPGIPPEAYTRSTARDAAQFCQAHLNLYPAEYLQRYFHTQTFDTFAYLVEFLYDPDWESNPSCFNWAEITSFFDTLDDELSSLSPMGQGSC